MPNDQNCMQKSFKKSECAKHFKKQCTQQSSGAEVVLDSMASVNAVTAAVAVASLTFNRKGMLETRFSCREGFQIGEGSLILFPG